MTHIELTIENYKDVMHNNEMVIIQFWLPESDECVQLSSVIENVSKDHTDIVFAKVDTQAQEELTRIFTVKEIPAMAMTKEGIMVYKEEVVLAEEDLNYVIEKCRDLDMDAIRKELESE